jgi:hypothetical protein
MASAAALEEDTVDLYLWVIHGINVSAKNVHHPMEYKFKSLSFYAKPFEILNLGYLYTLASKPCDFLLSCPLLPLKDKETDKTIVYVPPLVFSLFSNDNEGLKEHIGLWKLKIKKIKNKKEKNDEQHCELLEPQVEQPRLFGQQQLLNYDYLAAKYGISTTSINDNHFISYAQLFSETETILRQQGIQISNASIGIFSCQAPSYVYAVEYNTTTSSLIANISVEIPRANIVGNLNDNKYSLFSIIGADLTQRWSALATLKTQGCGLNVLAYLGIINQDSAREKTTCLESGHGTSIFKIVDYINLKYQQDLNDQYGTSKFAILRVDYNKGMEFLFKILTQSSENTAIIYKEYIHDTYEGKTNYYGHTVALCKAEGNIFKLDPQQSSFTRYEDIKSNATFMDLIFFETPRLEGHLRYITHSFNAAVLTRPNNISYGGEKTSKESFAKGNQGFPSSVSAKGNLGFPSSHPLGDIPTNKSSYKLDNFEKITLFIDGVKTPMVFPPRAKEIVALYLNEIKNKKNKTNAFAKKLASKSVSKKLASKSVSKKRHFKKNGYIPVRQESALQENIST